MSAYPLSLHLAGRKAVIVGAGAVATRRIAGLLDAGALVTVIAPSASDEILDLSAKGCINLVLREFRAGDTDGAWIIHTATGVRAVDDAVAHEAESCRIWCVRADDAALSAAWTPASATVDEVTVAVTSRMDPRRSAAIRNAISDQLRDGRLPARATRPRDGHVVLIGGGPGDVDLITVKGRRELAKADVVVFDRLAPLELLDELADDVELINASKQPHLHTLTQDQINAVIVDRARQGKRVVRLKGGDPFVFGRGSEEVQACAEAGVTVEVVPGISSSIAAPASAGIPVTHRGVSNGFAVITGHELRQVEQLAALDITLVVLMGVKSLPQLTGDLLTAGKEATTPVAVIERASTPQQRVTTGTLETIAQRALEAKVANPAVIVIGDVVTVPTLLSAESGFAAVSTA